MNTSPGHHRHGIVFVDEDRECDELDTYHSLRRFAEDSDDSDYAEPDSVSEESESDSFHSEGEEIAEYWDPYCESTVLEIGLLQTRGVDHLATCSYRHSCAIIVLCHGSHRYKNTTALRSCVSLYGYTKFNVPFLC